MAFSILSVPAILFALAACVLGEKHTVTFENNCGYGTPRLIKGLDILSTGEPYTHNGSFSTVIAYLQTGECLHDGVYCTLIETTLGNPKCPGCGSSTDISLIPPLAFNVPVDFTYYNGCDGLGATCMEADCETAFFDSDDNQVQVHCQEDDVNLKITFCPNGKTGYHDTALPSGSVNTTTVATPLPTATSKTLPAASTTSTKASSTKTTSKKAPRPTTSSKTTTTKKAPRPTAVSNTVSEEERLAQISRRIPQMRRAL